MLYRTTVGVLRKGIDRQCAAVHRLNQGQAPFGDDALAEQGQPQRLSHMHRIDTQRRLVMIHHHTRLQASADLFPQIGGDFFPFENARHRLVADHDDLIRRLQQILASLNTAPPISATTR